MSPDLSTQQPPQQPPQASPRRPAFMRDPRMGFRRQFTAMTPQQSFPAQPPAAGEAMGQELYDDPYYRKVSRPSGSGRKRIIIIVVIVIIILAGLAAAIVLPAIKKNNPNGLFVNSKTGN